MEVMGCYVGWIVVFGVLVWCEVGDLFYIIVFLEIVFDCFVFFDKVK